MMVKEVSKVKKLLDDIHSETWNLYSRLSWKQIELEGVRWLVRKQQEKLTPILESPGLTIDQTKALLDIHGVLWLIAHGEEGSRFLPFWLEHERQGELPGILQKQKENAPYIFQADL